LSTLLLVSSCAKTADSDLATQGANAAAEVSVLGMPSVYNSEAEAEKGAQLALQGDGDAAFGVSLYFRGRSDWPRVAYWEAVALQNGSATAFANVAPGLFVQDDICKKMRGVYLMDLARRTLPVEKQKMLDGWEKELAQAATDVQNTHVASCLHSMPH
jgi:hypothetical protein